MWISFAKFELTVPEEGALDKARAVYRNGNTKLKASQDKEERLLLLEAWQALEVSWAGTWEERKKSNLIE